MKSINTFKTQSIIDVNGQKYIYFDLNILAKYFNFDLNSVPNSIKIILENLVRKEDGQSITNEMISSLCSKINDKEKRLEIEL